MKYVIEVKDLWWKYETSKDWVLKNINLKIKEGEFVGIIGPSGAGKTTLCLCISGIIPHSIKGFMKGKVKIYGKDTRNTTLLDLIENIGVVFQDPDVQFVTMRVIDEIAFVLENQGLDRDTMIERINEALSLTGMLGFENKNPLELSGGQKQRVAIASMIARRPKIMIFDEPTSDLDPLGKREIYSTLSRLRKEYNLTIILVCHDIEELVKYADRIVMLKNGTIVREGPPHEFFKNVRGNHIPLPQVTDFYYKLLIKGHVLRQNSVPLTIEEFLKLTKEGFININMKRNINLNSNKRKSGEVIISLRNVSYTYPDGTVAINGVNIDIRRGEFLAIIGPNGSGKTTLLKLITGIIKPTRGSVKIFGKDSRELNISDIAFKIGFVFQNPDHQLFCSTVYEECAYALRNAGLNENEIRRRVKNVLKELDLSNFENTPPYFLSKGQRQRLALATVLVMEPEVIIVDEPTTGQDYEQSRYIMELLKKLNNRGKTIIIVTHDMKLVAEYAERVIVLKDGKILADAPTREIFKNVKLLEEISLTPPQITLLTLKLFKVPTLTVTEALSLVGG